MTTSVAVPLPPEIRPADWAPDTGMPPGSRLIARLSGHAFRAWAAGGGDRMIGNAWLSANGVDPARLIHGDGITVWLDPEGREWLQVDYFVPGDRSKASVLLNAESGRTTADHEHAMEPSLDRLVVPVTQHPDEYLLLLFEAFVDGVVALRPDLPGRYWLGAGQVRRRTVAGA